MHIPVLLQETLQALHPQPGECFVDGTLGAGGHAREIMKRIGQTGTFIGIDRDSRAVGKFQEEVGQLQHAPKTHLVTSSYARVKEIIQSLGIKSVDGLLLDLGFSSDQVDDAEEGSGRGFSFRYDEPLLMTYDDATAPVKDLIRQMTEEELTEVITTFGEERFAKRIAHAIKAYEKNRPLETTKQLTEIICSAVPARYERGRIHPATRTFMALRIYANKELEQLQQVLGSLEQILSPKGRVAIISFHSLEDRLVKRFMKESSISMRMSGEVSKYEEGKFLQLLHKKPIQASEEELRQNPRARSAKLRVAIRI